MLNGYIEYVINFFELVFIKHQLENYESNFYFMSNSKQKLQVEICPELIIAFSVGKILFQNCVEFV